ncbi:MAG: hypothetical protein II453_05085 [Alphaproteobacteria bacterium]|nr:hypothetical protein [Alphaproteobacteria bacterium]MBQ4033200.1 hypothetical protein [Paludibacteraceae bacterium]
MRGSGSLLDPKSAYSAYVSPYYVEHGRGTESGAVTKQRFALEIGNRVIFCYCPQPSQAHKRPFLTHPAAQDGSVILNNKSIMIRH